MPSSGTSHIGCYRSSMERIGVRELRQNASRYLKRVEAGETVEVTDRGRLVARLVPVTPAESAYDRLVAEGRLIPATGPGWRTLPPPVPLPPGAPSLQEILDEQREDRV